VIGLATSTDLLHWELTEPILHPEDRALWEHSASNPYVMTHHGQDAMFYFGFTYTRPGRANSLDAPSLFYHDGALYHLYCAVSRKYTNEVRGIAVARSKPW